jgi:membrane protease YdiL (CAAX protease family)
LEIFAGTIVLGVMLCGIFSWVRLAIRASDGLPFLPYELRPAVRWSPGVLLIGAGLILLQLAMLAFLLWAQWQGKPVNSSITVNAVRLDCMVKAGIFVLLLLLLVEGDRKRLPDFGITFHRWENNLLVGGHGFLVAFPAVFLVLLAIKPFRSDENAHSMLKLLKADSGMESLIWIGVAVVILAPLAEELLFRVILQGSLRSRLKPVPAIAISSVIFAAVHGFPNAIGLLPLAVVFGYVYERSHSYLAVVVLHAIFNGVNLILALMTLPG